MKKSCNISKENGKCKRKRKENCIKISVLWHTCTLILIQNRGAFLYPENNAVSALSEKCRFLLPE